MTHEQDLRCPGKRCGALLARYEAEAIQPGKTLVIRCRNCNGDITLKGTTQGTVIEFAPR